MRLNQTCGIIYYRFIFHLKQTGVLSSSSLDASTSNQLTVGPALIFNLTNMLQVCYYEVASGQKCIVEIQIFVT